MLSSPVELRHLEMFDGAILFYLHRLLHARIQITRLLPLPPSLNLWFDSLTSLSFSILLGSLQVLASS